MAFYLPDGVSIEDARWERFIAVIYDRDLRPQARKTWCILGDGMSSRHGEFCKDRIDFMHSQPRFPNCRTMFRYDRIGTGTVDGFRSSRETAD